jgi:multiple sugar transport system substrate-binding protein
VIALSRVVAIVTCAIALFGAASCGGGGGGGGPATINLWVFNEPSGAFQDAVNRCSASSHGQYKIVYNKLSANADQQRQSLVRRLAAKDSSIDIMGMDVVWTSEFAGANWLREWPANLAAQLRSGTLAGPMQTAMYKGKVYAAPANSNTQLLWYRKDLVRTPPKTWDELIAAASRIKQAPYIEIQGAQYEGVTVWFNALVQSAGGSIVQGSKVTLDQRAQKAAEIMSKLAHSPAADPSLASSKEDQNRLAFEAGESAFQINWPFIYPSAKADNPKLFKNIAWAPYPQVDAGQPAKPPIGGINWGVSAYSKHPAQAFAAAACMRNRQNQLEGAIKGGLPPTLSDLYSDRELIKAYPFAALIRKQLASAGVRPQTPAYADVSLAVAKSVSPPSSIDTNGFANRLRSTLKDALSSRALL